MNLFSISFNPSKYGVITIKKPQTCLRLFSSKIAQHGTRSATDMIARTYPEQRKAIS